MRYAVVLAGVPGRISNAVKEALQARFSDNHVFRAPGATLAKDGMADYDDEDVSNIVRLAADAVFGKSKRPHGFCRNVDRPCALRNAGKTSCGKTEDQSCDREKPDFLIVLYQPGKNFERVSKRLHFASLLLPLTKECYNHQTRTVDAAVAQLAIATQTLGVIRRAFESSKTPLLLPPINVRHSDLDRLLNQANKNGAKNEAEQFKRKWFDRGKSYYTCRNQLAFEPAAPEGHHGLPSLTAKEEIALSAAYRLGCTYTRDFHYDVYKRDDTHLSGQFTFVCRNAGEQKPKDDHVNITVDDRFVGKT